VSAEGFGVTGAAVFFVRPEPVRGRVGMGFVSVAHQIRSVST
jgi:hypothetical protein